MKNAALLALTIILVSCAHSGKGDEEAFEAGGVTFRAMSVEPLPDLSTPRGCHHTVLLGDILTVFGGHTNGFKPLQTAEYFSGGAWHEMQMMYTHDFSAATKLPDGRIMLMGGTPDDFGIGQSWGAEMYDPLTHVFSSDGILDRKRARSSALVLPDGGVLVSGNWYAPDGLGLYRPGEGFRELDPPSLERTDPFILPASEDKIVVFGSEGIRGEALDGTVDVVGGSPYHDPFLDSWRPIVNKTPSTESFQIAPFTYLLVARSRETHDYAVIKFTGGRFSMLDMDKTLPMEGLEGNIEWLGNLQVDRPERMAWIQGMDAGGNVYLARIHYDAVLEGNQASVTFYCAAIPGDRHFSQAAVMMPGGRFAMVGGVELSNVDGNPHLSNFSTTPHAFILHTYVSAEDTHPGTIIITAALVALLLLVAAVTLLHRRKSGESRNEEETAETPGAKGDLMSRITALMEEKQLFRRTDLKLADIALELGTNVTYISACINGQAGISFNEFLTRYRVQYAQDLMKRYPDKKVSQIAEEAGFSGERSFFRNFKKITGVTPRQWIESGK